MKQYGYARVSTDGQDLDSQHRQLVDAGIDPGLIIDDIATGAGGIDKRAGWLWLMAHAAPGDTITVVRLDRVTRSLETMLAVRRQLGAAGVRLLSLSDPADDGSASGEFVTAVLAASADLERRVLRDRQAAGIAAARARGGRLGRPAALSPLQVREVIAMAGRGASIALIAATFGVSRATIRCATRKAGPYAASAASDGTAPAAAG